MSYRRRTWLGVVVSAVALYFALRGVALAELVAELGRASYWWLLPAVLTVILGQLVRAVRWQVLFGGGPRPGFGDAFAILSVGYLVSNLLPMRLGDPVRAWLVDSRTPAGGAEALATVMAERALDFLTVAALLAVWVPVPASRLLAQEFNTGPWTPGRLRLVALTLVALVYAGSAVFSLLGPRAGGMVAAGLRRAGLPPPVAQRAGALATGFAAGFAPLRQPQTALLAASWSVMVWLVGGLGYWLVLRAFAMELPFAAAIFAMGATALFAVLPSSPGYIGVFHYAVRVGLGIYGEIAGSPVADATAVSYAIVLHGITVFVLLALGVFGLWVLGISGAQLGRQLAPPREGL